jgi:hypothetical protein
MNAVRADVEELGVVVAIEPSPHGCRRLRLCLDVMQRDVERAAELRERPRDLAVLAGLEPLHQANGIPHVFSPRLHFARESSLHVSP